jgi:hypothetical protein
MPFKLFFPREIGPARKQSFYLHFQCTHEYSKVVQFEIFVIWGLGEGLIGVKGFKYCPGWILAKHQVEELLEFLRFVQVMEAKQSGDTSIELSME